MALGRYQPPQAEFLASLIAREPALQPAFVAQSSLFCFATSADPGYRSVLPVVYLGFGSLALCAMMICVCTGIFYRLARRRPSPPAEDEPDNPLILKLIVGQVSVGGDVST